MGEYWKPLNLTRREYIHPHRAGCGLKLGEWNQPESLIRKFISEHWSEADDVRAVSDYENEIQLSGTPNGDAPAYDVVDDVFTEVGALPEDDERRWDC